MDRLFFNVLIIRIIYTSYLIHGNLSFLDCNLNHRHYEICLSGNHCSITVFLIIELNTKQTITLINQLIDSLEHAKMVTSTTVVLKTIMQYVFNKIQFQQTLFTRISVKNTEHQEWKEMTILQHWSNTQILGCNRPQSNSIEIVYPFTRFYQNFIGVYFVQHIL